jgi:hypothetical protein
VVVTGSLRVRPRLRHGHERQSNRGEVEREELFFLVFLEFSRCRGGLCILFGSVMAYFLFKYVNHAVFAFDSGHSVFRVI